MDYHRGINKAEKLYFVQKKADSALFYYKTIFSKFEFVFIRDCLVSMQIALYESRSDDFQLFAKKAIKNGYQLKHFHAIQYIAKHQIFQRCIDSLKKFENENRWTYLKKIDTTSLKLVTKWFARDQAEKNGLRIESDQEHGKRYKHEIQVTVNQLIDLIKKTGIPAEKCIGLDQNSIVHELKLLAPSLQFYYRKFVGDYRIIEDQYLFDEYFGVSQMWLTLLLHSQCGYNLIEPYIDAEISSGRVHPRDIALLHDWIAEREKPGICKEQTMVSNGYFSIFRFPRVPLTCPRSRIDSNRNRIGICDMKTDSLKYDFQLSNPGMLLYFGHGYVR
jgi:hypothetical protein